MGLENFYQKADKNKIREEINEGEAEYRRKDEEINGKEEEIIPEQLISTDKFVEENGYEAVDEIYQNYEKAITRKDREALDSDRFSRHFFEGASFDKTYMFGDSKKGYLLGYFKEGVFVPSHFAPKNIRQGYNLMKELGASEMDSMVFVTEDIAEMLERMPEWVVTDLKFDASFREDIVKKTLAHNHIYDFESRLKKFYDANKKDIEDYNSGNNEEDYYDDEDNEDE